MSTQADLLARLTPAQRAVFELKLRERRERTSQRPLISRRADPSAHEMSSGQERIWFVERLQPGGANHITGAVRLQGRLSYEALAQSLTEVVTRHEILRSSYPDAEGRPMPRVGRVRPVEVPTLTPSAHEADARLEEARRLAAAEAERPFDLATGPLLRASLICLSEQDHVLVLVVHHIVADGWSVGVLVRELCASYDACIAQRPNRLPAPSIQYADYAAWQRQRLSGPALARSVEWWREQLAGLTPTQLPADRPRPAIASIEGGRESRLIDHAIVEALTALGRRQGATLFMTLLAAFQTLLARWTGQSDVAVGSPVAGRNCREIEDLVGLFVNMVVLRSRVPLTSSFLDFLADMRMTVTDALEHEEAPFEKVVDALGVERALSAAPLTPVVFAMQNVPTEGVALSGLTVETFDFARDTSRFDLSWFAAPTPAGLLLTAEYRRDLFDRETIASVLQSYVTLLESIARDPSTRLDRLPLLEDGERRRLMVEWNATAHASDETFVHDLVTRRAVAAPTSVAVVSPAGPLTYGELETQANRLGHWLRHHGLGVEEPVGLLLNRSAEFGVAALAVLRAGGAYVPLDPSYPDARLQQMAANAGLSVVLTTRQLRPRAADWARHVVLLDGMDAWCAGLPASPPVVSLAPGNLAYIVYTSGSTGTPKGVAVTHGGLMNLVGWHRRQFAIGDQDRATLVANVGFDASVWELWPYLAAGAQVHVADDALRSSPHSLWTWLRDVGISVAFLPTPLAEAVLHETVPDGLSLRVLLTGGDRLITPPPADARFTLVNNYGPTENTVVSTSGIVTRRRGTPPPIGRPIDNVQVYVLDDQQQPVPVGVVGELYVAGASLARGYVCRPRETAACFVPDPSGTPGSRMYRTGDLVRWLRDGELDFIGRRDQQVKVRGVRIELGEIEAALLQHPSVNAAVVTVRETEPGQHVLAAYVVAADDAPPDTSALRTFVKQRLPEYMVPRTITRIAAIPVSANGKVDRGRLPQPALELGDREFVAPSNEVEEIVVRTCAELLGHPSVSVTDNFFALGGHSLLVMRLSARLERALSVTVPLRWVFQSETLADLSEAILVELLRPDTEDTIKDTEDDSVGGFGPHQ